MYNFRIKQSISFMVIALYIVACFYVALTVGILELPDAFFFYNLGNLVLYHKYFSVFAFNAILPNTTNAPLYGIFIRLITAHGPSAMTLLSFTQLLLVGASGYFIFVSANWVKRGMGRMALCLFILSPFLFVYAVTMMSEVFTIFWVSLYMFILIGLLQKRIHTPSSALVLVACVLALTKFVFLYFVPMSIVFTIIFEFYHRKTLSLRKVLFHMLPGIIGLLGIFSWMGFVHSYHGKWAMTITSGRQLFHAVVWKSGLFAPKESQAFKTFSALTGLTTIPRIPGYEMERYFIQAFNQNKITEVQMDTVFREFALAALRGHYVYFFFDIFRGIYGNFTTPPFYECLRTDLGAPESKCWYPQKRSCRIPWFCQVKGCTLLEQFSMCQPEVKNPHMISALASLMLVYAGYYPYVMIGIFIFMCIGGGAGLLQKSSPMIAIVAHGGVLLGIQGIVSASEGRYTMIAYPCIVLCVAYAIANARRIYYK